MEDVLAVRSGGKRGRSKGVAFAGFFEAKIKTVLLRTRSAVHALHIEIGGAAAAALDDLAQFSDAGSLQEQKFGGWLQSCLCL